MCCSSPATCSANSPVRHIQTTFEGFLRGGGTVLAVTGNHDNENFCQTLRHAMTLAAPCAGGFGALAPAGRLYLTADPSLLRLRDPKTGGEVQFILMPYPTPARYLTNDVLQKYGNFEEKNRHLQAAFAGRLQDIRADTRFDTRLPTVLVAHVNVQGAELSSLFRLSENEDVVFADGTLPDAYTYVALGHIHKAQALGGHEHVRYSGSIERMDLGEQLDHKGVVVFEILDDRLAAPPTTLPLDSTPVYEIEIREPQDELPRLRERYPDHETALVNLHVHHTAGVDSLEEVLRELEVIFPRWYSRDWTERSTLGPALTVGEAVPAKGFEDTVREYLTTELTNYPEADRAAVMELAEGLLRELS
jgi:exonuclease SbcD